MTGPAIVNIVNFIRAVEPRLAMDLVEPVALQIELQQQHQLPATWLLQYDALTQGPYVEMLRQLDASHEVGAWFEVVQPLVEKAGLKWRGRYSWDWHSDVGFSVGYSPGEREKLADVFMAKFKDVFGLYPRSVGSWFMDAHLLGYLNDRYGIVASCNCKDQLGTDGYTLWGGYWNAAFYPSRKNAYMPAQREQDQIPVPVFRMLGSDPIRQYDAAFYEGDNKEVAAQQVVSLEPVHCGKDRKWMDWFFDVMFGTPCLAFAYAQAGQENSFGWRAMADGYAYQTEKLADWRKQGRVRVETLETSGRWFKEHFSVTPPTAITVLKDYAPVGKRSIWYNSRFYRTNLLWEKGAMRIRDIHCFNARYEERYLTTPCTRSVAIYDTLPVVEGYAWGTPVQPAGIWVTIAGNRMQGNEPQVNEIDDQTLGVRWPVAGAGWVEVICREDTLEIRSTLPDWELEFDWAQDRTLPLTGVTDAAMTFQHEGYEYAVPLVCGKIKQKKGSRGMLFVPVNGSVIFNLRTHDSGCV